jgi:predicted anti-sigma-YlaC factor YlaD
MYIVTGSIHREQGILSTAQDEGQTLSETEAESDVESLRASDQLMLSSCWSLAVVLVFMLYFSLGGWSYKVNQVL